MAGYAGAAAELRRSEIKPTQQRIHMRQSAAFSRTLCWPDKGWFGDVRPSAEKKKEHRNADAG
jgi:hypothetical protein